MKKRLLLTYTFLAVLITCPVHQAFSQGLGINSAGAPADPSAALDVSSASKGTLLTRMTTVERDNIAASCACTPAEGLMIFNTSTQCMEMFLDNSWQIISCPGPCTPPDPPYNIYGNTSTCPFSTESYSTDNIGAPSYIWTVPTDATIVWGQGTTDVQVSFGSSGGTVSVKSRNQMCSSTPVVLPVTIGGPSAPTAGTHFYTSSMITWNWNSVPGSTGYKYNTVDDFNSATDNGPSTSFTQTGLSPGTEYVIYVWAYNSCGNSSGVMLSQVSAAGCPDAWDLALPSGGPPSARHHHSLIWDSSNNKMILFGGSGSGGSLNDLWSYDPSAGTWTQLTPSGGPSIRYTHSAVWDPVSNRMLVFGGGHSNRYNDLWSYSPSANTWTQIFASGAPSPTAMHTAVWDTANNRMLIYGGYADNAGFNSNLWSYTPGTNTWALLSPGGGPPPTRINHTAVWDSSNNRMYVFGGQSSSNTNLNDLWMYTPATNTWSQVIASGAPTGRSGHSSAWNSSQQKIYVYAGSTNLNDLWSFAPSTNTWTQLNPNGGPPPSRWNFKSIWNSSDNRMIVFGGLNFGNSSLNDLWEYCP